MATDERRPSATRSPDNTERTGAPVRRDDWSAFWSDPVFNVWRESPRRFVQEMNRWFDDTGLRRGRAGANARADWTPEIETFQRGDEFVVRADLPGMNRDEIALHATDAALTIEGERRSERQEERQGYYRTERSYGHFCRVVPLPDGAIPDSARATFTDGVLEVRLQAPPREVSRGRRIDIGEGAPQPDRAKPPIYPE